MGTVKRRTHKLAAATVLTGAATLAAACGGVALGVWPASANAAAPSAGSAAAAAAATAGNPALVSAVASRLGQVKGIRAQFRQTQTLSAMRQPLVSTGSLLFYRERGVVWQIDTPYKTTYVIGDAGVTELNADGQRTQAAGTSHANGAQGVAQVSKMMRAMLGGDLSALYAQFDVAAQGTPEHWQMKLTPNQPQLAQSIKTLQMSGGAYLQTLRITLANGDVTQLDFTGSTAVDQLTPAERALLGAS
ncbi:MAG TPA: outer membrane lipoprotein carrier protein LolA [Paraburkholderia sp.]|nr:outer membrane lipoprotein carrier protein LolA [Paraburkholderia sp.]